MLAQPDDRTEHAVPAGGTLTPPQQGTDVN